MLPEGEGPVSLLYVIQQIELESPADNEAEQDISHRMEPNGFPLCLKHGGFLSFQILAMVQSPHLKAAKPSLSKACPQNTFLPTGKQQDENSEPSPNFCFNIHWKLKGTASQ